MVKKKAKKKKEKKTTPQKKPGWGREFFERDFFRSDLFHLLLFLFIFGLALMLRLLYLTSDPPPISWSQDLTTDAPTYVSFARAKILRGDWNPFGQYRFVLWINSAYTLISFLFYKLTGLGRFQSNLISVLLNIFTILFIYLGIRKALNKTPALLSSFFLGINFIMLVYSRNTFSEISTLFFMALGFYFLILGLEKNPFLILSGASHACAFLF
ncbi:MAG: glycosyltransferase family 39 protein [Candidatus Zixiibacteriota bacterium]